MIDPTLGMGKVVIDSLVWFFTELLGGLFAALFQLLGNLFTGLLRALYACTIGAVNAILNSLAVQWGKIVDGWNEIVGFVAFIRDVAKWLRETWKWINNFCKDAYDFFESFVKWLMGQDDGFGLWLWETIQETLTWLSDFIIGLWERMQDFIFENGIWLYEWFIGNLDRIIGYFINLIHTIFEVVGLKIDVPAGVYDALPKFIQWGMFFDSFVPVTEIFQLLGIYLIFVVMMSMVRFVRSLIPFVH